MSAGDGVIFESICFEILYSLAESRTNTWFGHKQVDSHWLKDAFLHIRYKHFGRNSDNFSGLFSGVEENKFNLLFQKICWFWLEVKGI